MGKLLPFRTDSSPREDREPKVIDLDGDEADEVFDALSSSTTRQLLSLLYEQPRPASELADEADTTLQNVRYHLEKLSNAELVEIVDVWYSSTGNEMNVYAPTDTAVVLFMGDDSGPPIRSAIKEFAGGLGVIGLAAIALRSLVDFGDDDDSILLTGDHSYAETEETPSVDEPAPTPSPELEENLEMAPIDDPIGYGQGIIEGLASDPGAIFFLGGMLALALIIGYRHTVASSY